jgi:hypothetical protein
MKRIGTTIVILILVAAGLFAIFANENYANGERIGTITQFSSNGQFFKTHEGHLNVTQTGMNSSTGFDFSVDRDNEPAGVVAKLDSAANNGWKVKLIYHEVKLKNWLHNRGNTDHFINEVIVLDRNFDNPFANKSNTNGTAGIHDTIYIVITPSDKNYSRFFRHDAEKTTDTSTVK